MVNVRILMKNHLKSWTFKMDNYNLTNDNLLNATVDLVIFAKF